MRNKNTWVEFNAAKPHGTFCEMTEVLLLLVACAAASEVLAPQVLEVGSLRLAGVHWERDPQPVGWLGGSMAGQGRGGSFKQHDQHVPVNVLLLDMFSCYVSYVSFEHQHQSGSFLDFWVCQGFSLHVTGLRITISDSKLYPQGSELRSRQHLVLTNVMVYTTVLCFDHLGHSKSFYVLSILSIFSFFFYSIFLFLLFLFFQRCLMAKRWWRDEACTLAGQLICPTSQKTMQWQQRCLRISTHKTWALDILQTELVLEAQKSLEQRHQRFFFRCFFDFYWYLYIYIYDYIWYMIYLYFFLIEYV